MQFSKIWIEKEYVKLLYHTSYKLSLKMVRISIQAAHEQVNPTNLLHDVIYMDQNGIGRCWTSDHYMPWWNTGASGGAAWPWLGLHWLKQII